MCDAAVLSNYRSQYIAAAALARTASGEAAILLLLLLRSRASRSQPRIDMIESNAMLYCSTAIAAEAATTATTTTAAAAAVA